MDLKSVPEVGPDKRGSACYLLHAGLLLGLFNPENGGNLFLRNVGSLSMDFSTFYPRKYNW
jgi:hypothetical protein